jgi:hypothetical protein
LEQQLATLKTKRAAIGDDPRTSVLDASIEKLALQAMVDARERIYSELETASLRVRSLTAQVRAASIFLREHSEACKDPDVAARLMDQVNRWAAGSMPSTAASIDDIQASRLQWLAQFAELK